MMKRPPKILNRIVDKILSYKPLKGKKDGRMSKSHPSIGKDVCTDDPKSAPR